MKKEVNSKKYFVLSIVCWILCLVLMAVASDAVDLGLGNIGKIVTCVMGIIFFVIGVAILYRGFTVYIENDEEARIEEYDERNEMIRGKVAQDANLLESIVNTIVMLILGVMGEVLALGLLILATIITSAYKTYKFKKYFEEM